MATSPTPWGYDVVLDAGESIAPLLTLAQFHEMTGDRFVDDERIQSAIDAATAGFRSWCGWHIAPQLTCHATIDGGKRTVWLFTTELVGVESVTVCGQDVTDSCEWSRMGLLRLPYSPNRLRAIEVTYTCGYADVPEDLAALVAHRVLHEVALPFGVQQEVAGSMSVSYATSAINGQGATHLTASDRSALSAYRRQEVC